jgi:hypothetical protein
MSHDHIKLRYFGIVCIASPVGVRPLDVVRLNAPLTQCSGEITNVPGTFGRHGRNDLAYVGSSAAFVPITTGSPRARTRAASRTMGAPRTLEAWRRAYPP